jgi:hypothetical protein
MKRITLLKTLTIALFLLIGVGNAWGQTTTIDFETDGNGYTPSSTSGSGSTDVFNRVNPNIGGNSTYIWAAEDISGNPSITLDQIDITGATSFSFAIDFLTPNSNDWDSTDELLITYSVDGGASQNLMFVQAGGDDSDNEPAMLDLNFDGIGDDGQELPAIADDHGANVGSNFATFSTSSISVSGSTLVITLQFNNLTSNDEGIYIDNIVITQTGGSPDPAPTNHPTAFAATANSSSQITVTWTDATAAGGEQLPSAYLVKASTGIPTAPADGTAEADAPLVKNISQGTEEAVFDGLTAGTTYNFAIWPYTNTGNDIDYKTGSHPTASAATYAELGTPTATAATNLNTTSFTANWNAATAATSYRLDVSEYETFEEAGGNATDLFISEYIDGSSGTNKAIEIYNGTGSNVDLSNYRIWIVTNGGSWPETTITLSGTLANGEVFVVLNGSDFFNLTNAADLTSSQLSFNGDDAIGLAKDITGVWTLIDAMGTDGSDPGTGWDVAGISNATADRVLTRKSSISSPNTDWDASRGTNAGDSEWIVASGGSNDDASGFGSHTFSGGSSPSFVTGYNNLTVNGTSQSVTGLTANTDYFYRVRAYTSNGDETSSNSGTIEVKTNKATETVSGTVSFSSLTNVGDGTAVSVTSGALTFDAAATIESLSVEHGVEITVNNGIGLQIDGDLHLKSPSSNGAAASFKDEGTTLIGGNYILERHIDAYTSAEDGWHLLASPFNENFAINGSDFDPVENDDDLYGWDEPTYTWLNHQAGNPSNFEKGKGYLVAYKTATAMRDFTASSDSYSHVTSDVELIDNASRTNNGGWHLVGNSFLSAVTWDTDNVDWLADNIEASAQVLDVNQSGNYLSVDKGETIQALQGFFVRVTAHGNNSLMLPASARTHSSGNFVKSSIQNALELKVTNDKNGYFDKTKVKILDGATQAYDADFDGSKLKGFTSAPQLYTVSSDQKELSINVISNNDNEVQMPLHFEARFDATYTIKLEDNTLPDGVTIFMTDLVLNQEINLNTTPTYSFSASEGDSPNRFLLHFGLVGLDENDSQGSLRAYTYNNTLYIQNSLEAANLRILDLQGRLLIEKQLNGQGLQSLPLDFPAGVYVVQLVNSKAQKSVKVIVE